MKDKIHPQYFEKATFKCACGKVYTIGSTKESFAMDICGSCHPFYTGKENLIDAAGRVERFKSRKGKASTESKVKAKKVVKKKEK